MTVLAKTAENYQTRPGLEESYNSAGVVREKNMVMGPERAQNQE
jgi:hypothetical protein